MRSNYKAWMCKEILPFCCEKNPCVIIWKGKFCTNSKQVPVVIRSVASDRARSRVIAKARKGTYGDIEKALSALDVIERKERNE